jgi:hypothetical protein
VDGIGTVADVTPSLAYAPAAVDAIGTVADTTPAVAYTPAAVDAIGTSEDATPVLATNVTITAVAVDGIGTVANAGVALAFTPTAVDGIGTVADATATFPIVVNWGGSDLQLAGGTYTWSLTTEPSTNGTQYVDGALDFTGATTIVLDPSVYAVGGDYVLFEYGSFPGGQTDLNTFVTIDDSALPLAELVNLQDKPHLSHVLLKLRSKPSNSTQYVDGDLTFSGPTTIYLDATLYATPGTYVLFEVTGTVSGLANVTIISEQGLFPGPLSNVGGVISVTLS